MNKIVADGIVVGKTPKSKLPDFLKEMLVTGKSRTAEWPQYEIKLVGKKVAK